MYRLYYIYEKKCGENFYFAHYAHNQIKVANTFSVWETFKICAMGFLWYNAFELVYVCVCGNDFIGATKPYI